jgi:hypothetical protein
MKLEPDSFTEDNYKFTSSQCPIGKVCFKSEDYEQFEKICRHFNNQKTHGECVYWLTGPGAIK